VDPDSARVWCSEASAGCQHGASGEASAGDARRALCRYGKPQWGASLRRQLALSQTQPRLEPENVHPAATAVGEILPARVENTEALGLGEAAPDAVRLSCGKGMSSALGTHGAGPAHGLRGNLPTQAGGSTLSVWVEELSAVPAAARPAALPVPDLSGGPRQPAHIRHRFASRDGRRAHTQRTYSDIARNGTDQLPQNASRVGFGMVRFP
jgi:hypothetical protein